MQCIDRKTKWKELSRSENGIETTIWLEKEQPFYSTCILNEFSIVHPWAKKYVSGYFEFYVCVIRFFRAWFIIVCNKNIWRNLIKNTFTTKESQNRYIKVYTCPWPCAYLFTTNTIWIMFGWKAGSKNYNKLTHIFSVRYHHLLFEMDFIWQFVKFKNTSFFYIQ